MQQTPIDQITPYHRNPRKNQNAVDGVANSIKKYGFNVPITVDTEGVIVTGHTRFLAAKRLGLNEVPVVVLGHLTAAQVTEFRIADNKSAEAAEWDWEMLIPELRLTDDRDSMGLYFGKETLPTLLGEQNVQLPTSGEGVSVPKGAPVATATPTQDVIDKHEQVAGERFEHAEMEQEAKQVEITCAHCAQSNFIETADIKRLITGKW